MRRAALLLACVSGPALAQSAGTPPAYPNIDANGVDLTTGQFNLAITEGSIGSGEGLLALQRYWTAGGWSGNWQGLYIEFGIAQSTATVVIGTASETFAKSGSNFVPQQGNGSTLSYSSSEQGWIYRTDDGVQILFKIVRFGTDESTNMCVVPTQGSCSLRATQRRNPNGRTDSLTWERQRESCTFPSGEPVCTFVWRLLKVENNAGYTITFSYDPGQTPQDAFWDRRTGAVFGNIATTPSPAPTVSYSYPSAGVVQLSDIGGRTWRFTTSQGQLTGIRRPSASSDTTTIAYGANGVTQVLKDGVTTGYARVPGSSTSTMTVTDANANTMIIVSDNAKGRPVSVKDQQNYETVYAYDGNARLTDVTAPELNKTHYEYDGRGNVTETRAISKTPGTPADIVTRADYPATCANPLTCNQPTATRDGKGAQTDYTYDAATGQVATVTAPAPTTGAVRPQTRYSYTTTGGVSLLTGVSACQTTASCIGTADEVKTTIAYNASLQPISVSSGAGNGSLTATTAFTYDAYGNRTYVDGPLPGTGDTTRTIYDLARQPVGVIGPDPDGAGSMKNRATRLTYNADGQVTLAEAGTTTGQSDANWAAFVSLQSAASGFDANARKVSDSMVAGGTTYALTQYSYDALGRPDCTTVRMNPASFGAPPAACALGTTGSFGPDRISKTIYDAVGRPIKSQTAVGTADQADEATLTYTANGRTASLTDGEGNRTSYVYDGFDRLYQQQYPSKTTPGTSDASDWMGWAYDANGNITQQRLRDGDVFINTSDALNRLTVQQTYRPTVGVYATQSYTYDMLGRLTSETSNWPHTNTFAYDALGRMTSETDQWLGAQSWQYDLAGRMTRQTWNDGTYADYDRFWTGEVGAIRLNGATSGSGVLAGYSYDDLGRRNWIQRGNGTATSYQYDAVSRLIGMGHDVAGTADDVSFAYTYNPAGQIATRTLSNDAYAWTDGANKDVAETPNGLNQLVTQGSTGLSHDARGNVSGIGSTAYSYDAQNLMTQGPGGLMKYDALGRLFYNQAQGALWRYTGGELTTEQDSTYGWIKRRYVRGPGTDEALTWFEGSFTDSPRWLLADERGSTIAVTDASGAVTSKLSYDDYGAPATTNPPGVRFQYTGQAWLPELGMHYYKARIMNPAIGRFMQTDPIGYAGGVNLYAYVGGDPVNFVDPSGLRLVQTFGVSCVTTTDEETGRVYTSCGSYVTGEYEVADYFPGFNSCDGPFPPLVCQSGGLPSDSLPLPPTLPTLPLPCIPPSAGPVIYVGPALDAVVGLGGGVSWQHFNIPSTGDSGWAISTSRSVGAGGFAGVAGGVYSSMGSYLGTSYGLSVPTGVARLGAHGSANASGGGGGLALGPGAGAYASQSTTTLLSSSRPMCPQK